MSAETYEGAGWTGRVMQALHVVGTLVLVNLLFVAGALAGLVVAGIMPAAVAAAVVLLPGADSRDGVVRAFLRAYRAAFRRANLLGVPFLLAAVALAADAVVLPALGGPAAALLTGLTTVAGLTVLLAWTVTITLLARGERSASLRQAVVVVLASPLTGLGVLVALASFGAVAAIFPVVLPLLGVSLPLAMATHLVDRRLASFVPRDVVDVSPAPRPRDARDAR
ncbi:MAG: DUF624 domain-containing protein [Pseudorhodoferax sp.]